MTTDQPTPAITHTISIGAVGKEAGYVCTCGAQGRLPNMHLAVQAGQQHADSEAAKMRAADRPLLPGAEPIPDTEHLTTP